MPHNTGYVVGVEFAVAYLFDSVGNAYAVAIPFVDT